MTAFRSSAVRSVSSFALRLLLAAVEDVLELVLRDLEHDVAEHLDEAAVAVVGEARVAALGLERLHRLVVQAQVQDGVHHAGHGELRAGAHADQQRVRSRRRASGPCALRASPAASSIWSSISAGNLVVVLEVDVADFGGNGEAGRHRHAGPAHFGQAGALAAEGVFHLSVAVGRAAAEGVDVLLHSALILLSSV